ncbi:DUF3710 domain-containing protein [Georgenia sp. Z1491]|uniref:DUF3710 domain-containing protein n=1 Tax=Georgenia sp. Z1491 TaxID=3416707 RepID=UPI003CF1E1A9
MGLFSRGRHKAAETPEPEQDDATTGTDDAESADEAAGPFDVADRPDLDGRLDLGALRIPRASGMKVRLELEKKRRTVIGTSVALEGSALQMQLFAAPRSAGLWDEVRAELAASVEKQKGMVEETTGRWGDELVVHLPVTRSDGTSAMNVLRFIGVDGPRWFLRGMLSGLAATDDAAAEPLRDVLADVVVDRGPEARAPREVVTLTAPGTAEAGSEVDTGGAPERRTLTLRDLQRGPETTETR